MAFVNAGSDRDALAPELDTHAHAPQVSFGNGPETTYTRGGLIADPQPSDKQIVAQNADEKPSGYFITRKTVIITGIITFIILIAGLGLGIGLGVGLKQHENNHSSNSAVSPTASGTGSTGLNSTSPVALRHGVYNDSSFASVETSDRNQHVFFQDLDGSIQHAQYYRNWSVNLGETKIQNARNYTPLAAIADRSDKQVNWVNDTAVFIIGQESGGTNASLLCASIVNDTSSSSWTWVDITYRLTSSGNGTFGFNPPFVAATNVSSKEYWATPTLAVGKTYVWVAIFSNQEGNPASNMVGASYDGSRFSSCKW
ncbi:hypothetical protein MMC20_003919 [Loxospora ochrophaea]|nr:hypothetical protein [Loxospora ochrophaea]